MVKAAFMVMDALWAEGLQLHLEGDDYAERVAIARREFQAKA